MVLYGVVWLLFCEMIFRCLFGVLLFKVVKCMWCFFYRVEVISVLVFVLWVKLRLFVVWVIKLGELLNRVIVLGLGVKLMFVLLLGNCCISVLIRLL